MTEPRKALPVGLLASLVLVVFGGVAGARTSPPPSKLAPIHGTYAPKIDPANFVSRIDNPYLPFTVGMAFHYAGVRGTSPQTDDAVVTQRTVRILGVTATAV